jgi:hypothetical protein
MNNDTILDAVRKHITAKDVEEADAVLDLRKQLAQAQESLKRTEEHWRQELEAYKSAESRLLPLAQFGQACLDVFCDGVRDVDGGWIQESATAFGLFKETEVTEENQCSDETSCECSVGDICYRRTPASLINLDQQRQGQSK